MNNNINFYVLKPEEGIRFGYKWVYADLVDPVIRGEPKHCPVCNGPISSLSWLPPHIVTLSSSNPQKWGDFVWGAGFDLMVSDRFKLAYEQSELKGITRFYPPAEIVRAGKKKKSEIDSLPTYHLIDYQWFGANQDDKASGLVVESPEKIKCGYCRLSINMKQDRIVIDPTSWEGYDIFKPRGAPVSILVTEKFKTFVEDERLKNYQFIPAEKYGYDSSRKGLWFINE